MVSTKEIVAANTAFAAKRTSGKVFVFTGATSGIGAATLEKVATMVDAATFYVAGRSTPHFAPLRAKVEALNPNIRIVFFECNVALLADVDAFSALIAGAEKSVDFLCMSQGTLPFTGSLELCVSLSYLSRARLVSSLLPLLARSPTPARVLSILNGGKETTLNTRDLGLVQPGSWTPFAAIAQTTMMTTLAWEHLAGLPGNERVTFLHAFPGLVRTDIGAHIVAPPGSGWWLRVRAAVVRGAVRVMMWLMGVDAERAGERGAYLLAGAGPAQAGGGAWLVDDKSEVVAGPAAVSRYIAEGWPERVWEFTVGVFERVLGGAT
ncbi:3-keto-steroid reductase [Podospora conica]|nr:3-keto-steroid reductase [Schizothecium conicum]